MILVNFKIYRETFGLRAVELAKICQQVSKETGVEIIPVVSALDVWRIKEKTGGKVYIQHIDEYMEGPKTGFVSALQAKEMGADGTLINHSEHRVKPGTIKKILKNLPEGFDSVVCLQSWGQTERWAKNLEADVIAYEPSHLIGSKDSSVASEEPEMIRKMVARYPNVTVLAGAGVKSGDDIKVSLKSGAKGVLVSSDIVRAKDPKSELMDLARAFSV